MALSQTERLLLERRLLRLQKQNHTARIVVLIGLALLAAPVVAVALGMIGLYVALADELNQGLARLQHLDQRTTFQTNIIRDRNGTLLRELEADQGKRTLLALSEIPAYVREATIAVEDKTFYTNPGVDPMAIARAAGLSIMNRSLNAGGASTITQQFVRHVAFSYEERMARSPTRKLKEIILAAIMARQYSKDQILEWYLNEINYGNRAYGIEAAAKTVFDKSARDLTLAEAALLVGLPQLPGTYDPLNPDPDVQALVRDRQGTVLDLMADNGYISPEEAAAAKDAPLTYNQTAVEGLYLAPHFVEWVTDEIEAIVGPERMAQGGLDVTTTLDLSLHDRAQQIVTEQVDKNRKAHDMNNGALVALEPRTGQVLAMVGSIDYWNKEIGGNVNVAIRERQPGSSIKPITYVAALENGITPAQLIWDVKMVLYIPRKFEPKNYDERFHGPVRLREALANSYNIPALKLLAMITPGRAEDAGKTGVELTIDTAHKMGITGLNRPPGDYGLSLTLGGGEVKLLDLTTAYATLANGGGLVKPHPVLKIIDSAGNTLYDLGAVPNAFQPEPAVSSGAAYVISDILADNNARAPAFGSRSPLFLGGNVQAAVKTGTTNDYRDNWTLGYTPFLTVGVWAGNNDNHPMKNSSGVTGAAPIWNAFMKSVLTDEKRLDVVRQARERFGFDMPTRFQRPKDVADGSVCNVRSLNSIGGGCPEFRRELFVSGTKPEQDVFVTADAVVVPVVAPPPPVEGEPPPADRPRNLPKALLCLPSGGDFGADKLQPVAVLPWPEGEEERRYAEEWAASSGWTAVPPTVPCSPEMAAAAMNPGMLIDGISLEMLTNGISGTLGVGPMTSLLGPSTVRTLRLNVAPGTVLTGRTVLTGTVRFDPNQAEYFKVELGRGRQPSEWITLGDVHREQVAGGPLEVLDAPSLATGDYIVRLVLVGKDGNFLGDPYAVPVLVER